MVDWVAETNNGVSLTRKLFLPPNSHIHSINYIRQNFFLKKAVVIFLTLYYSFAIVFFPMCDFSMVKELPKMYQHCKETEDPNLSVLDFFTEHLIDIDEIFEGHEEEKSEKPHQSQINQITTYCVQIATPQQTLCNSKKYSWHTKQKKYCNYQNTYSFIFSGEILHPPIA